jgi:hypothetical protein
LTFRAHLERTDGVLVMRRDENDFGHQFRADFLEHGNAVHLGHLGIREHQVILHRPHAHFR